MSTADLAELTGWPEWNASELLRTVARISAASASEIIGTPRVFLNNPGRFAASSSSLIIELLGTTSPASYFSNALGPPPNFA